MGYPVMELITGHEPHDSAVGAKCELYDMYGNIHFTIDEIRNMATNLSDNAVCALRAATWRKSEYFKDKYELNLPATPDVAREIAKAQKAGKRPGRKIHIASA